MTDEVFEEYRKKMLQNCRQFSFFGIQPRWRPGEKDVEGFCHDEVVRQFHDTRDWPDGGKRVVQMEEAWAHAQSVAYRMPTVSDVLLLGAMIEPEVNKTPSRPNGEFRHENVYIGDRLGVYPPFLSQTVELLVARAPKVEPGLSRAFARGKRLPDVLTVEGVIGTGEDDEPGQFETLVETVDDWYLAYEWIHPFRDGNGRSGKILHNWLNGTLDDPVLVDDYFRQGNP